MPAKTDKETNTNAFKEVAKNDKFVKVILPDVTGINLTDQEITKLKVYLRYETANTLFDSISAIYGIIGANFAKPSRFIIIPFINKAGVEHLNIQKI